MHATTGTRRVFERPSFYADLSDYSRDMDEPELRCPSCGKQVAATDRDSDVANPSAVGSLGGADRRHTDCPHCGARLVRSVYPPTTAPELGQWRLDPNA